MPWKGMFQAAPILQDYDLQETWSFFFVQFWRSLIFLDVSNIVLFIEIGSLYLV